VVVQCVSPEGKAGRVRPSMVRSGLSGNGPAWQSKAGVVWLGPEQSGPAW
jgi:hypothetical protein